MRASALVVTALFLTGPVARADAGSPTRAPRASLVDILRGGTQALVLDRTTGDYAVLKVGDSFQGYKVVDIERDQIVVVHPSAPDRYFVLPLVERKGAAPAGPAAPSSGSPAPQGSAPSPVMDPYRGSAAAKPSPSEAAPSPAMDPYRGSATAEPSPDSPAPAGSAVMDPYGAAPAKPSPSSSPVMDPYRGSAAAPSQGSPALPGSAEPSPGSPAAVPSPGSPAPTGPAVMDPYEAASAEPPLSPPEAPPSSPDIDPRSTDDSPTALAPEKSRADTESAKAPAPSPASPLAGQTRRPAPTAQPAVMRLGRRDLERSLSDFASLSREAQIERAPGGGIRIVKLSRGSFFSRIGLEAGDIVHRVAGHAIDTVDAAASAYAAVISAREVVVEVERRGRRIQLRYELFD